LIFIFVFFCCGKQIFHNGLGAAQLFKRYVKPASLKHRSNSDGHSLYCRFPKVNLEDFGIWKDALREKENWRMISYPGLTHAFTAGRKTEGAGVYSRPGKMDARVIQDIADFIVH